MKRVLVFGISGFTGSYFDAFAKRRELDQKYEFVGADSREPGKELLACSSFRKTDATDRDEVSDLVSNVHPTYLLNLVGVFNATTYEEYIRINVDVSRHILETVTINQVEIEKVLLIGSAAEYGAVQKNPVSERDETRPVNLYGLSKLIQTQLALYFHRNHRVPCVVARTFNVLGEGISPSLSVGNFLAQIEKANDGDTIRVGNLEAQRDFLPINEVVASYWEILTRGEPGEVYNVCSGVPIRMRDVLDSMIQRSGKRLEVEQSSQLFKSNDISRIYGDRSKLDALV
jgi:nucleoside-diphosphate-sugar epimerase